MPTLGITITFDDLTVTSILKNIAWNVNGNYFICSCEHDIPCEQIGKNEKYKWGANYIEDEYKINGCFEVED